MEFKATGLNKVPGPAQQCRAPRQQGTRMIEHTPYSVPVRHALASTLAILGLPEREERERGDGGHV